MRDDVIIRDMETADARVVGHLFVDVDEEMFPSLLGGGDVFASYVESTFGHGRFFSAETVRVAEVDGNVVGMCLVLTDANVDVVSCDECDIDGLPDTVFDMLSGELEALEMAHSWGDAYLCAVCVDRNFRGHGIGRALVMDAISRNDCLLLHCRADNDVANALYRSLGFAMRCFLIGLSDNDEDDVELPMMLVMERRV